MHDDLGLYALGALDDPSEFEAHLATCEECQRELDEILGALELADEAAGDFELPEGLKERTLARALEAPSKVVPLRRPNRFFTILAAAAVTVVAVGVGSRVVLTDRFAASRILSLAAPDGGPGRATAKVKDTPNG